MHTASGKDVRTRPGGKVSDVHDAKRGMDVHRGLSGDRRSEVRRADGSRLVAERGRRGYAERSFRHGGREFAHRSYYFHGRRYERFYRPYYFHGAYLDVYEPLLFYPPAFYGWAYAPWAAPIQFSWGFAAYPWYGYYGPFFAPLPVYASASAWLADYMISNSLADAYQAQLDAGLSLQPLPAAATGQGLTADVRAQISEEVRRQIALENSEAQGSAQGQDPDPRSSGIARLFLDGVGHVFVVGDNLDLTDSLGQECSVSAGDVLQMQVAPAADATAANLVVIASKGGSECAKASIVAVTLTDLQDMQNHLRDKVDQGLGELQKRQGKGLPALPPSAAGAPTSAPYTQGAPPMEPNIADELAQQEQQADSAEREAGQEAQAAAAPSATQASYSAPSQPTGTVEVSIGQTIAQVTGALGQPKSVVNLGAKQIYVYADMKITFNGGRVVDVQ